MRMYIRIYYTSTKASIMMSSTISEQNKVAQQKSHPTTRKSKSTIPEHKTMFYQQQHTFIVQRSRLPAKLVRPVHTMQALHPFVQSICI
mmetsp:Transcript_26289/g.42764  ORF Transcript_26289/g.42764 Transcript_26289/m.42764 type:complete len:89 (-) Transcript_26289:226-492(-)